MTDTKPTRPPNPETPDGTARRVGVEIEFGGIDVAEAARLVHDVFGGNTEPEGPNRTLVTGTAFDDFVCELDTKYAHPDDPAAADELSTKAYETVGAVAGLVVPVEIVSPPIPWHRLDALDPLLDALRAAGAEGTDASIAYGFGVHLNPEIASDTTADILTVLQAYVLLSDWLRDEIDVDPTRKLLPHTRPFPAAYARLILDPGYAPDLDGLIADYVTHNPTRNRELDMLPLFRQLAPDTLDALIEDERINARPTFHYRLPNTQLSDPGWTVTDEWNRWVAVEELAADAAARRRLADARLKSDTPDLAQIIEDTQQWLRTLVDR